MPDHEISQQENWQSNPPGKVKNVAYRAHTPIFPGMDTSRKVSASELCHRPFAPGKRNIVGSKRHRTSRKQGFPWSRR